MSQSLVFDHHAKNPANTEVSQNTAPTLAFYAVTPIIYLMIIPAVVLDVFITTYQFICFPAYGIRRVTRRNYISFDRHRLKYIKPIQRINCDYCAYFNGVIAYAREVAARTEQYFCPIRHVRRTKGLHPRHKNFLEYGDATNAQARMKNLRQKLKE